MYEEPKTSPPKKNENGLSLQDREWLANWFTTINNNLSKQTQYLRNVNIALGIIGLIVLLYLISRTFG
jgi:hypothetical protein